MLGSFNSRGAKLRFIGFMIFAVAVVSVLSWLIAIRGMPAPLPVGIFFLLILLAYFLFFWRVSRQSAGPSTKDAPVPKALLRLAVAYTVAFGVTIIYWINKPSILSITEVAIGLLVTSVFWYLVHRARKSNVIRKDKAG